MSMKLHGNRAWIVLHFTLLLIVLTYVVWSVDKNIYKDVSNPEQISKVKHKTKLGKCEKCGKSLRKVSGRYGDFVGCSGYPSCKYIQRKKASFCCPECAGCVQERKWSGGTIWGCGNYPDCRYAIFSDILDIPCDACSKSPYLLKVIDEQGLVTLSCPNKECEKNL